MGLRPSGPWRLAAVLVCVWLLMGARPLYAQDSVGSSPQLYLLPQSAATSNVSLESHVATLRLLEDGAGPRVALDATYRLRNPTNSPVALPVRLFPGGDRSLGVPQGVTLTSGEQPLVLAEGVDGGYTSQVNILANRTLTLRLRYTSPLGDAPLVTLRYAPAILNQWAGNLSLRVELRVPAAMPPESWVLVTPSDWRYSVVSDADVVGLHWIYDFAAPQTPFRLQLIAPQRWSALQSAEEAAVDDAPVAAYVRLGESYRDLMRSASTPEVRERFYAQAVAAYSAGLVSRGVLLAAPAEQATLHMGLADLYRRRIVDAQEAARTLYGELLVDETAAALALLPDDDARRSELIRWRADGLQVLLNQARTQRDWPVALSLVEALAALPDSPVAPELLAEQRRSILVQQALQLMEQGNREAAQAVAGEQLGDVALRPPPQAYSLFTGWQITVTATPQEVQVIAAAETTPDRLPAAEAALAEVVQTWQQAAVQRGSAAPDHRFALRPTEPSAHGGVVVMEMAFPTAATGILPARLLPPRSDYALLSAVLTQLAPTTDRRRGAFFEQVTMRQPLNLSAAATQWRTIAAGLEEQAASFDARSGALNAADVAGAEAALQARIQAVTYRTVAAEWRSLARQSRLHYEFSVDEPVFARFTGQVPSRAWTVTAAAPAQMLVFQTEVLSLSRVLLAAVAGFILLIGLTGLLWSLL